MVIKAETRFHSATDQRALDREQSASSFKVLTLAHQVELFRRPKVSNGLFLLMASIAVLSMLGGIANAQAGEWKRGGTLFGTLKYADEFKHYDHVRPDAPKGGQFNQAVFGSYDNFNPFVVRGSAAAGLNYQGGLLYDSLFEQSIDQPSASHALIAESFRQGEDYSWAEYRLNPDARFHDGKQITPQDVVWSMEKLRETFPLWTSYYKNVEAVKVLDERTVRFEFDVTGNRELPHIIGDLPVMPKHWWTANDGDGNPRDITEPTTEPPLGSGPYRIGAFDLGQSLTWERVEDYWADDHPLRVGRYNYDAIRFTYFLDQTAMWEAFKKGGLEDVRRENISRRWSQEYVFPAFNRGDVVKEVFEDGGPQPYQAYFLNTRLEKFSDPKVREAINYLFDFETMNKNLFFGLYTRTDSPFERGELESSGIPQGRELEILEPYRDQLDERVFTEPFELPVLGDPGAIRKAQRQAIRLFREAGYRFENGKMIGSDGEQFSMEFLGRGPTDERVGLPFIENLKKVGIDANLRIVDTAQFQNRAESFDYEVLFLSTIQSLSPGNEQREYWSSESADARGSRNYSGIKNPVIDELVELVIKAKSREELVSKTHALDRVLKWQFYTVPHWHNPEIWLAHWKHIRFPPNQPAYTGVDTWSAYHAEAD